MPVSADKQNTYLPISVFFLLRKGLDKTQVINISQNADKV